MYKIIGGDQKEYGPIGAEQIRQWIAEGRINARTKAQAEGSTDWKDLSAFPEFADAFGVAAPSGPTPAPMPARVAPALGGGDARAAALEAVKAPAVALLVTAILGLAAVAVGLLLNLLSIGGMHIGMPQMGDPQMQKVFAMLGGGMGIIRNIVGAVIGVVVLLGSLKMRALENYQFAFISSILAMVPCLSPCCLLGLPFGIWALVVLNKPEIKSQFR